ncbi:MAG TPA: Hpt domain-containing protein [Methanothrix sp.]|nr:Hpt domain-containing protein [Methanothrix sp.]
MSEGGEGLQGAIDRSVLASLQELQDEGEPDIVVEVAELFIKHAPDKLLAIEKAAENADAKGMQIAAHSLKSSSAYIGAMRLSAMCKELEQAGRSEALEGAKKKAETIKAEYERARNELESLINKPADAK